MLTINNIQFRNLEEQVLKNKQDIANHYAIDRALANLGIEIVGQVAVSGDLPDPTTYTGKFGDAYAVGNKALVGEGKATYDYYVYTRPDANAGHPTNYWLNVGKISVVGPQGPQGIQGKQGDPGNDAMWLTGSFDPSGLGGNYPNGTLYLAINTIPASLNGNVYKFDANLGQWSLIGNLRGAQGVQGIQGPVGPAGPQGEPGPAGERGDVGGFINIVGMLSNVNQLPDPETLGNLTYAYLVYHTGGSDQANDHYDLYIQVGKSSAEATWNNAGPFNAATLITVNGEGQNVWNADTKLDKNTNVTSRPQVYLKDANGTNRMFNTLDALNQGSTGLPTIKLLKNDYMTASEVNDNIGSIYEIKLNKPDSLPSRGSVLTYNHEGVVGTTALAHENPISWTIPLRDADGCVKVGTPKHKWDAATKEYVDGKAGGISIIKPSEYDSATMTVIGAVVCYISQAWPVYQFVPVIQTITEDETFYNEADYSIVIGTPDGSNITMINDYVYYSEYDGGWGIGNYADVPIKGDSFNYSRSIQYLYVK